MGESRQGQLTAWTNAMLQEMHGGEHDPVALEMVSGDASFRRYFRARLSGSSVIAVDAPPANEDSRTFVRIGELFGAAGVNVPRVFASDFQQGFLLLSDFGDTLYLDRLQQYRQAGRVEDIDRLYREAITALVDIQQSVSKERLDPFDRKELRREMNLFREWFCGALLNLEPDAQAQDLIDRTLGFLEDAALAQPEVAVHRDYHSRNLLVLDPGLPDCGAGPGIIDFQDAVRGAYTYDLVSLLRDAYIAWPWQQVEKWAGDYLDLALDRGVVSGIEPARFMRDFDLMGLQRQLKVIGIFSRLAIRDNKPRYLADIPLVIRYFLEAGRRHPEMTPFLDWFEQTLMPVAETKLKLDT